MMKNGAVRWLAGCLSVLSCIVGPGVWAGEVLLCVRGQSFVVGHEFQQTRQVLFTFDGPEPGDLLAAVSSQAAKERLWPGDAEQAQIEPYDEALCGNEPRALLTLRYDNEEFAAIREDIARRGPGSSPALTTVTSRAVVTPAPAKAAPPDGTAAGTPRHEWFRVYFATNRKRTKSNVASGAFDKEPGDLVFGTAEVSIPFDHRWARLESPSVFRLDWDLDPARHILLGTHWAELEPGQWKQELAKRASGFKNPGVLLFIHGYRNSFADAAQRAAQLGRDLAFDGPTVVFSWPSDGELIKYMSDEEDARTAWRQMAEVLDMLATLKQGTKVLVVAHSMGNRVLIEGLAHLLQHRPNSARAFKQVVLASPDIGERDFKGRWSHELAAPGLPAFTMYASKHDIPVALSAWLHNQRRLGSGGSGITVLKGLESIDASAITEEWFGLSHSYFGDNRTVLSDLFTLIHLDAPAGKRASLQQRKGTQGWYWEFAR